jgi:subtilisin family serine protease
VNAALSRNFSSGNSWTDGHGHGSHVAGIIGAKDNCIGVIGVAPGVELVAVRVLNNAGSGTTSDVIAGVDYVAQTAGGVGVANLSLGGGGQLRARPGGDQRRGDGRQVRPRRGQRNGQRRQPLPGAR